MKNITNIFLCLEAVSLAIIHFTLYMLVCSVGYLVLGIVSIALIALGTKLRNATIFFESTIVDALLLNIMVISDILNTSPIEKNTLYCLLRTNYLALYPAFDPMVILAVAFAIMLMLSVLIMRTSGWLIYDTVAFAHLLGIIPVITIVWILDSILGALGFYVFISLFAYLLFAPISCLFLYVTRSKIEAQMLNEINSLIRRGSVGAPIDALEQIFPFPPATKNFCIKHTRYLRYGDLVLPEEYYYAKSKWIIQIAIINRENTREIERKIAEEEGYIFVPRDINLDLQTKIYQVVISHGGYINNGELAAHLGTPYEHIPFILVVSKLPMLTDGSRTFLLKRANIKMT